jgi:ParB-like chromosome segregation protein Spo0J
LFLHIGGNPYQKEVAVLEIKRIPLDQINPAKYNSRKDLKPGDPEYEKLIKCMEIFGYVEPIVWNKRSGHIVSVHQRLKILQQQAGSRNAP